MVASTGNRSAPAGDTGAARHPAADGDAALLRGEFDRVGQKVEGDLLERAPVGAQADAGCDLGADFEILILRSCRNDPQCVAQFAVKVDILQVELEPSG